jgi:SAM-dependent methyltransferase
MYFKQTPYTSAFYSTYAQESYRSARVILPIIDQILPHPKSIVDVGCGIGTWLRAWKELGATTVLGIDGTYVGVEALWIDKSEFLRMDLRQPRSLDGGQFDLAQTLEVAEHLPESAASRFVAFLCSLSPVVLFSAAIPSQGGTSHVNERWPEYWADIFDKNGYSVFDVVRPQIWENSDVAYYYAQNTLIFASRDHPNICNRLEETVSACRSRPLAMVHPKQWEEHAADVPSLRLVLAWVPQSAFLCAKYRFQRAQCSVKKLWARLVS